MAEKRQGYVYVLHFDRSLSHAQHYIGCTTDPRGRLITHAQARGARIVRAALAEGIGFQLGALGVTNMKAMRRIERQLKDWHGVSEHCGCCQAEPRAIPGTQAYPIEEIPWPIRSIDLARLARSEPSIVFRFTSDQEPVAFVNEVQRLMNTEKDALGFLPCSPSSGIGTSIATGRMAVCHVDGILAGYVAFGESPDHIRIHQAVVRDAQRRCGIGRRLVEMVLDRQPGVPCYCKVRDDLLANEFWPRMGFAMRGFETHETSGSKLNCYVNTNGREA